MSERTIHRHIQKELENLFFVDEKELKTHVMRCKMTFIKMQNATLKKWVTIGDQLKVIYHYLL